MKLPVHQQRLIVQAARHNIPMDVSIELTHHCNFRCRHCYIPDFSAPDLLSTERLLTLLEELADIGTLFLTFTGGELFLRRDWLPLARRARELGFALRLFSNGTLIDED
ncbi:MAG: radical SAM protein, partial [Acidobacteriota bacterium]